jgi:hypothetical protein
MASVLLAIEWPLAVVDDLGAASHRSGPHGSRPPWLLAMPTVLTQGAAHRYCDVILSQRGTLLRTIEGLYDLENSSRTKRTRCKSPSSRVA